MTTRITVWGTAGRIFADRQECQVYLRDGAVAPEGYEQGWNVSYTTELTEPVWFYLRGEEYSAQIDPSSRGSSAGRRTASTASPAPPSPTADRDDARRCCARARRHAAVPKTSPAPGAVGGAAPVAGGVSGRSPRAAARRTAKRRP